MRGCIQRRWAVLIGLWFLGSASVYGQIPAASYGFLDLLDPCAVTDEADQPMLTFARFDVNDAVIWTKGFADIDAWCRYAATDPNLAGGKTEQPGWILCGGDEEVFWPLQSLLYICPFCRGIVTAVESRPLLYDVRAGEWGVPGIALTDGDNLCYQATAFVSWNPTIASVYDRSKRWHHFPPLVALAHELIHAQQRVLEDEYTYGSTLQIDAMKGENLARYAFHRKVPGYEDLRPRPGNQGYYIDARFNAYFDDMEWADWSPDFNPLLDIFEEQ